MTRTSPGRESGLSSRRAGANGSAPCSLHIRLCVCISSSSVTRRGTPRSGVPRHRMMSRCPQPVALNPQPHHVSYIIYYMMRSSPGRERGLSSRRAGVPGSAPCSLVMRKCVSIFAGKCVSIFSSPLTHFPISLHTSLSFLLDHALCALHPAPCTLHPVPCTLHSN